MVRKLRTLSGCLTCRVRRKKCDESKPQCTTCDRLRLRCNWASGHQTTDAVPDTNGVSSKSKEFVECNLGIRSIPSENLSASNLSVDTNGLRPHRMAAIPHPSWSHFFAAATRLELQSELSKQCPKLLCLTFNPLATSYCSKSLERELGQCTFDYAALSTFSASVEALQFRDIRSYELGYRVKALSKLRTVISKCGILQSEQALSTCIISTTLLCLSDVSLT